MNKFIINSVKIHNVNSHSLPLKNFVPGLNIICGANEAGKSSLMKFLKHCFFTPKNLSGDLEVSFGTTKYLFKIDGNKKVSDRILLLSPEGESVEAFKAKLNENFYKKAFTINLDDIKALDGELFKLIQDHNAVAMAKQKEKLKSEISEYLTENTNKPKNVINDIVKNIKALDSQIRSFADMEEKYSSIIAQISDNEVMLGEVIKKIENKVTLELVNGLQKDLCADAQELEELNFCFNKKLFEYKSEFYELAKKSELISDYIKELKSIRTSSLSNEIEQCVFFIKRDFNILLSEENIGSVDLTREYEFAVRNLYSLKSQKEIELKSSDEKKQVIIKTVCKLEKELEEIKLLINNLKINDYEIFRQGLGELKASIVDLSNSSGFAGMFLNKYYCLSYLFISMILLGMGIWLNNITGYFLDGLAVFLCFVTANLFFNKKVSSVNIYDYVKKEILPKLNYDGSFLPTVAGLNNILMTQEACLKEYELLKRDFDKKTNELENVREELNLKEVETRVNQRELEDLSEKFVQMTTVLGVNLHADLFFDFLNDAKCLSEKYELLDKENSRYQVLSIEVEKYLENITSFLEKSGLDNFILSSNLDEKLREIQALIDKNEKTKYQIEVITKRINELKSKLSETIVEDMSIGKTRTDLENERRLLDEQRGKLYEIKNRYQEFEGLVDLRNKKNIEHNRLKDIVKIVYKKRLINNFIELAQQKQREQEPNLVSAENLLRFITGGKYVAVDFSTETIKAVDGEIKSCENLSRGTKEQVYLAFKLGYAQNYGADGKNLRLPLIIDDAFVNFDKERLTNVLNALKEFSKTNQVLLFTCHKDYITNLIDGDVNIVDL